MQRILTMLCLAAFAFALVGCSGSQSEENNAPKPGPVAGGSPAKTDQAGGKPQSQTMQVGLTPAAQGADSRVGSNAKSSDNN